MIRCHILVEGQTEEAFVNKLLLPHLELRDIYATPVILKTKRLRSGGHIRGGVSSWAQIHGDLLRLLRDSAAFVTTMLDYYRLPKDVPGMSDRPDADARTCVEHVEQSIAEHIGAPRLIPHIMLHEFEALLFAGPPACASVAGEPRLAEKIAAVSDDCGGPELIDEGAETAPSKRIKNLWPDYRKTADGPVVTERIGLRTLRSVCPHFGDWLTRVESLSTPD